MDSLGQPGWLDTPQLTSTDQDCSATVNPELRTSLILAKGVCVIPQEAGPRNKTGVLILGDKALHLMTLVDTHLQIQRTPNLTCLL